MRASQTMINTAINITSEFEGAGFANISGNFDKQGISAGLFQWNLGQETLQKKILKPYIEEYSARRLSDFFPISIGELAYMNAKDAVAYAKKHMLQGFFKKELKPEWREAWLNFLTSDRCIEIQKKASMDMVDKAEVICTQNNLSSKLAFCFVFDVVVQNGSFKGVRIPSEIDTFAGYSIDLAKDSDIDEANYRIWCQMDTSIEQKRLMLWIMKRAVKNKWRKDVLSRKGTIIHRMGHVHKSFHDFTQLLGVQLR